ncbi:hypothetical protein [Vibrio cholerae]|uniref:hypothetical protein n=1 Tax=Vibrio cholerae TaxID=666 RepID=UPI0011D2FF6E|nr:hypothetical protein [Vibrio cholerae]EHE6926753.1 hypothetical protein [Vibrio cholerae]EKF9746033.1 hypothetical protein [Vibrio cholerae]TXY22053.1 hypothetical protein FXE90_12635 [Vibrio cholerae]GHX86623.1 hypothetical protein VCSRO110_3551 [Vibrio cholerae]HDI3157166.1 hypothetical protein [Vibrio cholerae]
MDILKGVVSKLKSTIEISGGGRDSSVTTTHVTIFHLDGQPVKIKSREAVIVDNSDTMTVAGKVRNGVFNAYAYINNTTGVSGNIGLAIHYFFGIVFPFAGLFAINTFSDPFFGVIPTILGAGFIGVGLYMFYKGTQISKASKLLRVTL